MNLPHFLRSIQGAQNLDIEQRIFNVSAFSISVFALVGTLLNYLIGLNLIVVGLSFIGSITSFFLYYLSRYREKFSTTLIIYYLIAIVAILGVMYFYNNGYGGTVAYLIIVLLNVFIIVVPKKYQYYIFWVMFIFVSSLFLIELQYPELVTQYISREEAAIDHITTIFYSMGLTTYVLINFRNQMLKDRQEIMIKTEEINLQKIELENRKTELENTLQEIKDRNDFIETLLRELSHRVKNNLQLVISLLDMQIKDDDNSIQKVYIQDTKNRLISLILVHQKIYGPEQAVTIFMPEYIHELAESINILNLGNISEGIIEYNIEPLELHVEKVISLGLIINEIITNSFKHAFIETSEPKISISFRQSGDYTLHIQDNGSGFDDNVNKSRTGLSLIHSLTKQLKGKLKIESNLKNGTSITLKFQ